MPRDTALAAYLARPDQRSYDLTDLALRYLHRELRVDVPETGQLTLRRLGDDGAAEQNLMLRARATLDLADAIDAELSRDGERPPGCMAEVELPLSRVLGEMEQHRHRRRHRLPLRAGGALRRRGEGRPRRRAYEVVGREFNLGSPKQLQEILFTELGLPKTKKIKTGYTTDADALQWLYAQTGDPVLAHLLRHRDVAKLKSTVDGLLKSVSDDGADPHHLQPDRGRHRPALLHRPQPAEHPDPHRGGPAHPPGVRGRGGLRAPARPPTTARSRCASWRTCRADDALIEAFNSGADFHAATASSVFDVPLDEVTPDQRRKIKAMNYGLAYGLSAFGLSQQLSIGTDEARGADGGLLRRASAGSATTCSAVVAPGPRRTATPPPSSAAAATCPTWSATTGSAARWPSGWRSTPRSRARPPTSSRWRCCASTPALRAAGLRSRMLLQVHDELVFEVAPGERESLEALVRREMGGAYPLSVPLEVSVGLGRDWNSADH